MASVVNDPNGRRRILFVAGDGTRKAIRLGKVSERQAVAFKVRLEQLVGRRITGALDDETARWVAGLDDTTHGKLAAVGLVATRQASRLGPWVDGYLAERADLKPGTVTIYRRVRGYLLTHFGADRDMRTITRDEASKWHAGLATRGLAPSTVKTQATVARLLFRAAVTREVVTRNPFDHLPCGATATKNERYVTPADAAKVAAELPAGDARTVFALARYAGLRVPSETHKLRWADVDWHHGGMNVRSPKTERHEGHERREVPITDALLPILREAFEAAEPGQVLVVRTCGPGPRARIMAAASRVGVEPWADLFRTLRSSCEREWAMVHPQYAVSKWIGHSLAVSGKHYVHNVPDELFARAAAAAQNPAQHTHAATRTEAQSVVTSGPETAADPASFASMRDGALPCVQAPADRGVLLIPA